MKPRTSSEHVLFPLPRPLRNETPLSIDAPTGNKANWVERGEIELLK
jgi:hypothetical protein